MNIWAVIAIKYMTMHGAFRTKSGVNGVPLKRFDVGRAGTISFSMGPHQEQNIL